ncbi:plasmid mobilization protein [Clostridium cellulovorans]|uniref:Uncharacterized protein n=1 Tax=Clostridium cellulovorans (strain ATCC 35296 / DSM 3052 / OCM 3 / 743B) TaxID=573061 RepID=D9SVY2_CLOC7|nr:hypothetical protein [Clostridium cellulovorans]ADL53193.1 hypothetical protein Clocel_3517 [Clostridium cellulovorans 743B]
MKTFAYGLASDLSAEDEIKPKEIEGRKPIDKIKYERIVFRVTEEEKLIFEQLAKVNGMTVSAYIRYLVLYQEFNKTIKEV